MESSDLSQAERNLLVARKYFSSQQFKEAILVLESMPDSSCDYLNGEKNLLLATANSNSGNNENSFLYNGRAIAFYKKAEDKSGEFLATHNLHVDANLLGLKRIGQEYLDKASDLVLTIEQKFLISRARACILSQERKYLDAYKEIKSSIDICHECTNKLDVFTLKVVASDIFFRANKIAEAQALLEEIKNEKLLKPKARVFFNIAAIKFLSGTSLGLMPKYVSLSAEYSLKWNLLLAMECGDLTTARKLWSEIVHAFPGNFQESFQANTLFDQESLFFKCVLHIKEKASNVPQVDFESGSKMAILHECLLRTKSPIRKEELIELIWKTPYDPSLDSRFYKLIQRLKSMDLPIANEHRAYYYKNG